MADKKEKNSLIRIGYKQGVDVSKYLTVMEEMKEGESRNGISNKDLNKSVQQQSKQVL